MAYAVGQLVNGVIGDYIKAKYMICLGLLIAGISNFVFVTLADYPGIAAAAYTVTGFSLSMIYGPMTKVVAESTDLIYATRCNLGYTFSSFLGSPAAGLFATFLTWQVTFNVSSIVLAVMAVLAFMCFTLFEKKGIVRYGTGKDERSELPKADFKALVKRSIVKFSLISMITGIIRTSFIAYLSTYFCEHLGYNEEESASIFSVTTLIISFTALISIFVYERLNRNMHLCPLIYFGIAALGFLGVYFVSTPIVNIVFMVVAIMASNASATILWSVYCPSMKDTGFVSGITGFLDFLSYAAAALGSLLIPKIATAVGWENIALVLLGLMLVAAAICVPYFVSKKKDA